MGRGWDNRDPGDTLGTRMGTGGQGSQEPKHSPMEGAGAMFIHRRRGPSPGTAGARGRTSRGGRCRSGRRRRGVSPSPGSRHSPRSVGSPDTPSAWGARNGGPRGSGGSVCTHQAAPTDAQVRGAGAAAGAVQHPAEAVVEVVSLGQAVEVAEVWGCQSRVGRGWGDARDSREPAGMLAPSLRLTSVEGHPAIAGGGAQDGPVVVQGALHGPEGHGAAGTALWEHRDGAGGHPGGWGHPGGVAALTWSWQSRYCRGSPVHGSSSLVLR